MELPSVDSSLSTSNKQEYEGPQTTSNYIDDELGAIDKSRYVYQRTVWNKLNVSIGYLIYKVNAVNIGTVKKELLQQNLIRGKNMFCQFITQAQRFSTTETHTYATLVAVINLILPEIGELVLNECIMQFTRAFLDNEISDCSASVMFIGHLINQGVADEKLAVELLTISFGEQDIFSIKVAIVILEICGKKISETHEDILNKVFDVMLNFLNNEQLDEEGKNILKSILKLQENGFKFQQFDLVPANECQITHSSTLVSVHYIESNTISYRYDPLFEKNEKMYKNLILKSQEYDYEEENGLEYVTDFKNQYDGEKKLIKVMKYIDDIENDTNILSLQKASLKKVINCTDLTIDYTELAQLIIKYYQVDINLCFIIMDCCCEHSTYINHFGLLTKELSENHKSFADMVEIAFIYSYVTSDNFNSHRSQIVATYFAHLSNLGLIPYRLFSIVEKESIYPNTRYSSIFFEEMHNIFNNISKKFLAYLGWGPIGTS